MVDEVGGGIAKRLSTGRIVDMIWRHVELSELTSPHLDADKASLQ